MTRAVTLAEIADGAVLTADSNNSRVGIGSTQPTAKLDVGGNAQIGAAITMFSSSGIVSATSFHGDGSNLSGITAGATLSAASGAQRVVVTSLTSGTMTAAGTDADLAWNSTTNTLSATNINVSGTLTYEDVTNIDSVGIVTARTGVRITDGGLIVTAGVSTLAADLSIADKIVHTGDTNTAIRFPAADTFTVETAGSERLRVKSDGNVGINTNNPSNLLHIDGGTDQLKLSDGAGSFEFRGGNILKIKDNGTERLRVDTSGHLLPGADSTYDLGLTGTRFRNVYADTLYGDGSNLTGISAGITTTKYSPTANAIIQIGLGTAQHHELTLTAGFTTITTSGGSFGESHSLVLIQPSSGIATVGFSTFFQFPSGATPSMSEGSSKVDLVSFVVKDIAGNTGTGATELLASAGLNYS